MLSKRTHARTDTQRHTRTHIHADHTYQLLLTQCGEFRAVVNNNGKFGGKFNVSFTRRQHFYYDGGAHCRGPHKDTQINARAQTHTHTHTIIISGTVQWSSGPALSCWGTELEWQTAELLQGAIM